MIDDDDIAFPQSGLTAPQIAERARVCETVSASRHGKTRQFAFRQSEPLLQACLGTGLMPTYSCLSGECGSCMARIMEGMAVMQINECLSQNELDRGYTLVCQAFPASCHVAIAFEV